MKRDPFSQGFIDGMRLAKAVVLVPFVAVALLGYVVNAFAHERTVSMRDVLSAVKHQLHA